MNIIDGTQLNVDYFTWFSDKERFKDYERYDYRRVKCPCSQRKDQANKLKIFQ